MHQFLKLIFGIKLYMFQTVPLSIIRSFSLYTQQWYMSYRFADSLRAGSGQNSVLILLASRQQTCMTYTTASHAVKTPDDGQRNCPKHAEFYSKNKFEKLVHLVGFIIGIFHHKFQAYDSNTHKSFSLCNFPHFSVTFSFVRHCNGSLKIPINNAAQDPTQC